MLGWLVAVAVLCCCVILVAAISHRSSDPPPLHLHHHLLTPAVGIPGTMQQPSARDKSTSAGDASLICKPSALANYLLKHCRAFSSYSPCVGWRWWRWRWWWRCAVLLQSAYHACRTRGSPVRFVRDHLQLADEGLVSLDWAVALCGTSCHKRRRTSSSTSTSPVLLIIPNSFGKITRNVLKLCEAALSHGYLPVVFNRRSHNGTPLTTLKLQQFGDPADLREAVRYIRYRQPAGRLYAAGESTGSGLLLSYLGECGSSSYITAAACLSPIFRCQSWFEGGLPRWVQWALVLYQKTSLSRYRTVLGETVHAESLFSSSSLRGLEESLFCQTPHKSTTTTTTTAAAAGTGTCTGTGTGTSGGCSPSGAWEAYWERNEPLRDVDEVAIPVLSICARDDPVRGHARSTLPLELFETNPHFFLLLTEHGGHCGFRTRSEGAALSAATGGTPGTPGEGGAGGVGMPGTSWSHRALLEFFRATTDFFAAEERAKQLAARRRGPGGGSGGGGRAVRHRSISTCKKVPACSHNIHAIYSWQRSYTR